MQRGTFVGVSVAVNEAVAGVGVTTIQQKKTQLDCDINAMRKASGLRVATSSTQYGGLGSTEDTVGTLRTKYWK